MIALNRCPSGWVQWSSCQRHSPRSAGTCSPFPRPAQLSDRWIPVKGRPLVEEDVQRDDRAGLDVGEVVAVATVGCADLEDVVAGVAVLGPAWMRKGMCGSRTTEEERVRLSRLSLHHDVPAGRAGATPAVVAVFPGEVGQLISGQALEIVDHGVGGRDSLSGGELLQIQRVTGVTLAVGQALLGLPGSLSPRAEGAGA